MKIEENVSLKSKTSFRIGGSARFFALVSSKEDLIEAYAFAKKNNLPIFVLGEGTDILISDRKYDALVVRFANKDFSTEKRKANKYLVTAGAGLNWDEFVEKTVGLNLQGIECLSGIPGSVGACPVQNVGAYGQEVGDTLFRVEAFDTKSEKFVILDNSDCQFGYRESVFKKQRGRFLIYKVDFVLKKGSRPNLTYASLIDYLKEKKLANPSLGQVRKAVLDIRSQKLENPDKIGNAGSFFKNPIVSKRDAQRIQSRFPEVPLYEMGGSVKIPAGWLIDKAGWKGKRVGGAMVSDRNALVIVNSTGKAKALEVKRLASRVTEDVKQKFGVKLEPEVQDINF